jgi:hypothetical protein
LATVRRVHRGGDDRGWRLKATIAALGAVAVLTVSGPTSEAQGPTTTAPPTTEPAPAPTLVATPSTDLVDGQMIGLEGTGWDPATRVRIFRCSPAGDARRCQWAAAVDPDDEGAFAMRHQVFARVFIEGSGDELDCRRQSCELVATTAVEWPYVGDDVLSATIPLEFDPDAELMGLPSLRVEPDTGLVDGQRVAVIATDIRYCNPFFPNECEDELPLRLCGFVAELDVLACTGLGTGRLDSTGGFHVEVALPAVVHDPEGATVSCYEAECSVAAFHDVERGYFAPVSFAAPTPSPPPPTPAPPVPVSPDFAG